jgi:hypothetical protein
MNGLKHYVGGASLALILTFAASVGFVLGGGGILELCDSIMRTSEPARNHFNERLVLTESGTPIIQRNQWQPFRNVERFDLERKPIERPVSEEAMQPADLPAQAQRKTHWLLPHTHWTWSRKRVQRLATAATAGENWYVVFNGNRSQHFYLQGLRVDGGEIIGYIGRDGFQDTKPAEENLFLDGTLHLEPMLDRTMSIGKNSLVFLMDDRQLLAVDLANRTVEPLMAAPILSMDALDKRTWGFNTSDPGKIVAVRTRGRVHVLEWNGAILQAFLVPEELRDQSFEFFALDDEAIYFTRTTEKKLDGKVERTRYQVIRVTESGDITERTAVSLSHAMYPDAGLGDEAAFRIVTAMVPATLWSAGIAFGLLPEITATKDDLSFWQALKQRAGDLWWVVALVAALCGWLAWLTFRRQQQHGEPNGWFWAIFVFLFGLPGYIGYRLHRRWPHHKPLPAPEPTGLEVFAH